MMRQWLALFENQQGFLYHGTSMSGLAWMTTEDRLVANGGEGQVSLTRNINVARKFTQSAIGLHSWGQLSMTDADTHRIMAKNPHKDGEWLAHRAELAGGGKGAVLILDWAKLAQDYEIESVDFGDGSGDEEEEAVFQDIAPLSRYLVGIEIDHAGFQRYCELVAAEGTDGDRARVKHAMEWVRRYS